MERGFRTVDLFVEVYKFVTFYITLVKLTNQLYNTLVLNTA